MNFFSHVAFSFSSLVVCHAPLKLTDCHMPSWHTVQPMRSIGCGDLLPRYASRLGCVVNGCGYFSKPALSIPRWQVVHRSIFGTVLKFTSSTTSGRISWLILIVGARKSSRGALRK